MRPSEKSGTAERNEVLDSNSLAEDSSSGSHDPLVSEASRPKGNLRLPK